MIGINDRMKTYYEDRASVMLTRRMPVILRVDGRAFHTLTRSCERPFDSNLALCVDRVASVLCNEVQGAKMAYIQSDEVSLLLHDYDRLSTDAWFDYNIQKIVSISAAIASVEFTFLFGKKGIFDARVFNIPREEACNYFISRQQDWARNSVSMFAWTYFSQKELEGKKQSDVHDMLHSIGQNWADLSQEWKNGRICLRDAAQKWSIAPAPIFKMQREVVEDLLIPIEL